MSRRRAVALVLSTGWGVRTFLQTEILPRLLAAAPVVVLAAPDLVAPLQERYGDRLTIAPLQPFDPARGAHGRTYRRRNHHFLHLSSTATRRANQRHYRDSIRSQWRKRLVDLAHRADAAINASPASLARLAARERRHFRAEYEGMAYYEGLFATHDVGLVVSTVAFLADEAPPALVARSSGIPTVCWVTSWDNLSSKPAYFCDYDHYLVWSEPMAEELRRYYPESRPRAITITGVPHFDWYDDPAMHLDRAAFCDRLGLDPARPLLLYATATPHLAPAEHLVVERLMDDLAAGAVPGRPQLIVRLHPSDPGGRFAAARYDVEKQGVEGQGVDGQGDDVRLQQPGGAGRGIMTGFLPNREANVEYVNTLRHADVVINLASTVSLEAALCDRPTLNVAYDLSPDQRYRDWVQRYYDFTHYRTVVEHGAVRLAYTPEQLVEEISAYLETPSAERAERARLAHYWCGPRGGAGARVAAHLLTDLAAPPTAAEGLT